MLEVDKMEGSAAFPWYQGGGADNVDIIPGNPHSSPVR